MHPTLTLLFSNGAIPQWSIHLYLTFTSPRLMTECCIGCAWTNHKPLRACCIVSTYVNCGYDVIFKLPLLLDLPVCLVSSKIISSSDGHWNSTDDVTVTVLSHLHSDIFTITAEAFVVSYVFLRWKSKVSCCYCMQIVSSWKYIKRII